MSWTAVAEAAETDGFEVAVHWDGEDTIDRVSVRNVGAVNDEEPGAGRAYEAAANKALRKYGRDAVVSGERCSAGEADGETVYFVEVQS
jgi:hypothetical protein